jgi:hypothetical protein
VRAIIFEKPGEFSLTEVPDPVPGPHEAAASVSVVDSNPQRLQAACDVGMELLARCAVEMFAAGALNAKPMISHAFALSDYGDALEIFRAGTGRKVQIRPRATESVKLL